MRLPPLPECDGCLTTAWEEEEGKAPLVTLEALVPPLQSRHCLLAFAAVARMYRLRYNCARGWAPSVLLVALVALLQSCHCHLALVAVAWVSPPLHYNCVMR